LRVRDGDRPPRPGPAPAIRAGEARASPLLRRTKSTEKALTRI